MTLKRGRKRIRKKIMDNLLIEIAKDTGEIKGEVKGINKRLDTLNNSVAKNKDRINRLETFRDNLSGKIIIIVAIVGVGISIVSSYLKDIVGFFIRG